MTDNDGLVQQAERYSGWMRVFLFLQAVSYLGWIGSKGLSYVHAFDIDPAVLSVIGTVCWPIWTLSLIATFWLIRRTAKNRQLAAMMNDERTRDIVGKVYQMAYWVLLVVLGLLYAVLHVIDIDARGIVALLLSLAVAIPSLGYAAMSRA